ncbi:MAG: NAD(P)/FAD-dependent oxidoreductase [Bacilli bacterium]|nr:NAD(P)/FAD-dependent oxidoreductase [Bacilli bacterium]
MIYDVIIVGGGVIGCAIARELSKYKLRTVLLEKNNDVCNETSAANSAIVHSGYDPLPNSLKAQMNVLGNSMYPQMCKELDVPFIQNGSLTIATTDDEMNTLLSLQKRANENKVETKILSSEEVLKLEPQLNKDIKGALFAPTCGIVNPFELTVALMENAMDNGVELLLNHEVNNIKINENSVSVFCKNDKELECKVLINAAGLFADDINAFVDKDSFTITPRKGQYFVLDHFDLNFVKHTLFMVPSDKGKGVLVTPTTSGNYLIGPSSDFVDDKQDLSTTKDILDSVRSQASRIIENIPYANLIRQYSGLRAVSSTGDFIIEHSKVSKNLINVAGIQSPGLASCPAIALKVVELLKECMPLNANEEFNPIRRKVYRLKEMSLEDKNKLISENPQFGHIVCRCEKISEGEIVDCIHRNCGATTVKGVKKRCRPGFGKCQGAMCEASVIKILARELKKDESEILYSENDSNILKYETKVGDCHD